MPNFNSRRWTKEDIAKLKNLAQKYPTASVAGQLGRTAAATAIKAHELKLSLKMQRRNTQGETAMVADPGPRGMDLPK
jgi:hypothetical protein